MANQNIIDGSTSRTAHMADIDKAEKAQAALFEIADAASAMTDMPTFYAALHRIVGGLMYAKSFYVSLYDPATRMLSAPYFADVAGDIPPPPTKLDESSKSLRAYVLQTGKTLHVSAKEIEEGRQRGEFTPMGTPSEDWIGVPLKVDSQVMGMLTVQSYEEGVCYDDQDVQLLEFVAQHIAVALTRARAIDETRQRNAELQIINTVQEGLAANLDFNAIIHLVGSKLYEIFNVSTVQINIYEPSVNVIHIPFCIEEGNLHLHESHPLDLFRKQIVDTKQTLIINEKLKEIVRQYGIEHSPAGKIPQSLVGVPLLTNQQVSGIIWLEDNDHEGTFTEPVVRLVTTLANSMSVALENARLWEQEKLYRKALERELEIGREIQEGFLPEAIPQVEGWEIAALLISAREVAGDFYDAFELPDGNIALVIADVCDKGVGAALFMTLFRSLLRVSTSMESFEHTEGAKPLLSATGRLKRAVSLTNNYIAETHGESGMFATLFFGILSPKDGKLTYVNGGHEPPLIIQSGTVRQALLKTGPAVGVIENCQFDLLETQLKAGEILFSYTDGVPDTENLEGEFFGRERLHDILQSPGKSAQELVKTIEIELRNYIGEAIQSDDITLLVVKRSV